ncbi:MAG: selenide, water dikinase SelD [Acidobacteriota bacterium]
MSVRVLSDAFIAPGPAPRLLFRIATALAADDGTDLGAMGEKAVAALASQRAADLEAGRVLLTLNLLSLPSERTPFALMEEVARRGADAAERAGLPILGGHTLDLDTKLYGVMTLEETARAGEAPPIPEAPAGAWRPVMGYAQVHGCGAKLPPDRLAALMPSLVPKTMPALLASDDAVVIAMGGTTALGASIDVITPITNDPASYAEIAVAGCFSDLYAKGCAPACAVAVLGSPPRLDPPTRAAILAAAMRKAEAAGAIVAGVHEVPSQELFFGLFCAGPGNARDARPKTRVAQGDRLVLTKALGTGVISTMEKRTALRGDEDVRDRARASMAAFNDVARDVIAEIGGASAVTDVTGFSLVGHVLEMVEGGALAARLHARAVPLLCAEKLYEYVGSGMDFCSMTRNRHFLEQRVRVTGQPTGEEERLHYEVLYDAQTSGGLLVALDAARAERLVARLRERGATDAAVVGEVVERSGPEALEIVLGDPAP